MPGKSQLVEKLLGAALLVLGLTIAVRALAGPVYTPINLESIAGLLVILLLLMRSSTTPHGSGYPGAWERTDALLFAGIAFVTAAAFWPAAHLYFLPDDFIIVLQSKRGLR